MKTVELKKGIYWVGAIDWNVRDFHGYSTPFGTTYNAYLIVDEKAVLVDTVKAQFFPEMLGRISEIIDPTKIDYVIANHVEVDHSGSLPPIVEKIGNPTVVTSFCFPGNSISKTISGAPRAKARSSSTCFRGRNPPKHTLLRSFRASKGTPSAFIHGLRDRGLLRRRVTFRPNSTIREPVPTLS